MNHLDLSSFMLVHVVAHPCCPLLVQKSVSPRRPGFPNACLPRNAVRARSSPTCLAPTSERKAERTCLEVANRFPFPSFQGPLAASLPGQTGHGLNYLSSRNSYLTRRDEIIPYSSVTERTDSANRDSNFGLSRSSLARGLNVLPLPFPFFAVPKR
jgi:hypothetical protein